MAHIIILRLYPALTAMAQCPDDYPGNSHHMAYNISGRVVRKICTDTDMAMADMVANGFGL